MTLLYEKILFSVGGLFAAFCVFSVLFGEAAAFWIARLAVIGGLIAVVAYAITQTTGIIKGSLKRREHESRKTDLELKKLESEAERAALESQVSVHRLNGPGMLLAVDNSTGSHQISSFGYHPDSRSTHAPAITNRKNDHMPALEAPVNKAPAPLLPMIQKALVLVLIGPQGTGKTTLLQHLIDSRHTGKSIIIDPHGFSGKYPGHAEIIGKGRNYAAIQNAMDGILDELNNRYKIYQDQTFDPLYIYIDELTLLNANCENFKKFMRVMLTESRKVGIRLTACLHSRRVQFLGIDRAGDLADGITFVSLKNNSGRRWAELETEGENIKMELPGPYTGNNQHPATPGVHGCYTGVTPHQHPSNTSQTPQITPGYTFDFAPCPPSKMSLEEQVRRVMECWETLPEKEKSITKVSKIVFGRKSGPNNKLVREILGL